MRLKKTRMSEEAATEGSATIDSTHAPANNAGESLHVFNGRVGQGGRVEVRPELFHRIQFRGVGREPLHSEPGSVAFEGLPYLAAAVGGQVVPHQDEGTSPMASQGREKAHHLGATHAAPMQRQQPAGTLTVGARQQGGDSRKALPVERFDHARRLPARGPGGPNRRPLREAGFVHKTEPSLQFLSVFFYPWPRSAHPSADGPFMAFARPPIRAVATP